MGEMEILTIENLNFTYPIGEIEALNQIDLSIHAGDFVTLVGESGSGKSTLLKLIKKDIAPFGQVNGEIRFFNQAIEEYTVIERAQKIGFVFQNPDEQIVMGNVFDELVFGLENLQYDSKTIRNKIAEVTQYFGIQHLLERETETLSGGEKQLVNLASVLALDPEILLLDEPTAQLDPIAAKRFIQTIKQLNDEFGITILIVEHRLEEVLPLTDQLVLIKAGEIIFDGAMNEGLNYFTDYTNLVHYLPHVSQLYLKLNKSGSRMPVTVNEGRRWLAHEQPEIKVHPVVKKERTPLFAVKHIDYQYQPNSPLVLNNLSGQFFEKSLHAILGANGSGKSTFLKLLAGIYKAQHGTVKWQRKEIEVGYISQNPLHFFMYDTIGEEYERLLKQKRIEQVQYEQWLDLFGLEDKLAKHPQDLSGGEIQKAALLGTLLLKPDLLILDEPTKGLDPATKKDIGNLLRQLISEDMTIILASHDLAFVAEQADYIHFMFQGQFTNEKPEYTTDFFENNQYYTTTLKKMTTGFTQPPIISIDEVKDNG